MMPEVIDMIFQYGIAAAALIMMYQITYNHLTMIQTTLSEIKDILQHQLPAVRQHMEKENRTSLE